MLLKQATTKLSENTLSFRNLISKQILAPHNTINSARNDPSEAQFGYGLK